MMRHPQQRRRRSWLHELGHRLKVLCLLILFWFAIGSIVLAAEPTATLKAVLLDASQFDEVRAATLRLADFNAVVLRVESNRESSKREIARAFAVAQRHQLPCYFWIEVARCPTLADKRPELMASLQGHPEWRRFFPQSPQASDNEVVKTYPWVPIMSREGFDAQLARVTKLLEGLPAPDGLFLNDLQGAPSACGCGHPLCRWTTDYGPKRTNEKLGHEAAAQFVAAVAKASHVPRVIPVWATECEAHDKTTLCAGVGCYEGLCWKEFVRQLTPLAERSEPIALLLPFREFERDLPIYPDRAGWIREAVELMQTQPRRHRGTPVPPERLITVLQGWDVTHREVMAQIAQSQLAGASGFIVSLVPIDQSWEPRIMPLK